MKKYRWILVAIGLVLIGFVWFTVRLPRIPDNLNDIALSNPTTIYADDGQIIKVLANRQVVHIDQISPLFLNAIIAIEDDNFYSHHGFSKRSFLRAMWINLKNFKVEQGGSTITQQLAKNLFFSFDKSPLRKVKELFVALQMERQFTKNEILEAYVNQIDFGSGIYGIELASQTYFAKHADELTLAESAMLAGIPNSPGWYNPYRYFENARNRQEFVLSRMQAENFITLEQHEKALEQEMNLRRMNPLTGHVDYFVSELRKRLSEKYGQDAVNYGGLHIHTTLNTRMQYEAFHAVRDGLYSMDALMGLPAYDEASWEEKLDYPQAALVAVDPHTGAVKALVGGRDYRRTPFNRALANNRSAGSAFKVFTYMAVLDKNVAEPTTVFVDEPVSYQLPTMTWTPQNFDREFHGPMILKEALAQSRNVIAAKLIDLIKPQVAIDYAKRMGITSDMEPNPSISLGATGVSPLEMASAYASIASLGIYREPFMLTQTKSVTNQVIDVFANTSERVVDPQTTFLLLDMMRGVVESGTAQRIRHSGFDLPCAGKTGTTNDYRDAWFIGFTPDLVVGVWVGFDDNRKMINKQGAGVTGSSGALPIWINFMKETLEDAPYTEFPIPQGIDFKVVDPRTGSGAMPGGPSMRVAVRTSDG